VSAKKLMRGSLAEESAEIKRGFDGGGVGFCAICAYVYEHLAQERNMATPIFPKSDLLPESPEQDYGGFAEGLARAIAPLPSASVDSLKARGFTNDEIYAIVAPRRTLARRKERGEELTQPESDRVRRLEHIADMADRVFASHEKAQRWLRKESRVLRARPIDLLQSESGARVVEQELHAIDYGMFA
jgi:putative toxin-antitoxin system antitoxin component (TIGR02293 family)